MMAIWFLPKYTGIILVVLSRVVRISIVFMRSCIVMELIVDRSVRDYSRMVLIESNRQRLLDVHLSPIDSLLSAIFIKREATLMLLLRILEQLISFMRI